VNDTHRAALAAVEPQEVERGRWIAELDGYPGVWAMGYSREECLTTLAEVFEGWLVVKRARGDDDIRGKPPRRASPSQAKDHLKP
jgi:predicted RNase H-like HicB family nuclease